MICLRNDVLSVKIKERGAELSSAVRGGREYIWQGDEATWGGQCPVLFPVCGRLRGGIYRFGGQTYAMPLHGFAKGKLFSVRQDSAAEAVFTLSDDEETRALYPFSFVFSLTYALCGDELSVTYAVRNAGKERMWFNFGSHESYRTEGEGWTLRFAEREDLALLDLTPQGLLAGTRSLLSKGAAEVRIGKELFVQDSLVLDGLRSRSVLLCRGGAPAVQVRFAEGDRLVLWRMEGAPFFCIEPWNGLPDLAGADGELTRKEGILSLGAGERFAKEHVIRFFPL